MKDSDSRVAIAALMAHAPVLIPSVAGSRADRARASLAAMTEAARQVAQASPETLILISPHTPRRPGGFTVWAGNWLKGSLSRFGVPDVAIELPNDRRLMEILATEATARGAQILQLQDTELDHGATVPLWHLLRAGWIGPTLVIGLPYPGTTSPVELGEIIAAAVRRDGRACAIVASGDMSHRLKPGAPGGYHPEACGFDQSFIECLRAGDYQRLLTLDPDLQDLAGEDVVDSTLIATSAVQWNADGREVLSYEGPFGVGYGIAILHRNAARRENDESNSASVDRSNGHVLPRVARRSIEAALRGDDASEQNFVLHGILAVRLGVFVTIRSRSGELRGCVGTISPRFDNTLEETWHLAREAAFRDHRFKPVQPEEIDHSRFEVSVVFPPEAVRSTAELDPRRYGLLVATDDGRRGALLPGLDGVETVEDQLEIARRKGGILAGETTRIQRFVVEKFCELDGRPDEVW